MSNNTFTGNHRSVDEINKFRDAGVESGKRKSKVAVCVENAPSDPIPVIINDSAGVGFFEDVEITAIAGTEQTVITRNVAAGTQEKLSRLNVSSRFSSETKVYINSVLVGTCKTGPANPDAFIDWEPSRPASASQIIEVKFRQRSNSPVGCKVQLNLMGYTITL